MSGHRFVDGLRREQRRELIGPDGKRIYVSEFIEIKKNVGLESSLFKETR